jgi:rubrerythrin
MNITYSAEEIFQIGVDIEINGQNFYKAAADAEKDPDMKKLFKELSDWEAGHVRLFEKLKKNLPDQKEDMMPYDPEDQYYRYLKTIADSHIFNINKNVLDLITRCDSSEDILKMALHFEKDSVVLYTAMKKLVPEHLGQDTVDKLIDEEISHVSMLQDKIKQLN